MTPFVDIAFLLLIFFMTTSSFKPPDPIAVALPASHSEFKVPESDVLVIYVGQDGTIAAKVGLSSADEPDYVAVTDLSTYVLNKRVQNMKLRLAIRADKDVPYGVMADVMKAMQASQTLRFNLVTELEGGGMFETVQTGGGGH